MANIIITPSERGPVHNIHHNKICDTELQRIYAKLNVFFWQEKLDLTFCLTLWHLGSPVVIRGSEPQGVVAGHDGVPGDVGGVDPVTRGDVRVTCSLAIIQTANALYHQSSKSQYIFYTCTNRFQLKRRLKSKVLFPYKIHIFAGREWKDWRWSKT